jgi:hypothetical protein
MDWSSNTREGRTDCTPLVKIICSKLLCGETQRERSVAGKMASRHVRTPSVRYHGMEASEDRVLGKKGSEKWLNVEGCSLTVGAAKQVDQL